MRIQQQDSEVQEAIIKITKVKEVFKIDCGKEFNDKLVCVKILRHWGDERKTCFKYNKNVMKEVVKFISEELSLK